MIANYLLVNMLHLLFLLLVNLVCVGIIDNRYGLLGMGLVN